uniref:Uncharacterized protein n=1 Tax=Macrostomum lignano TaxID=282301 RepID=A0A1I8JQB2_9PLAT
MSADVTRAAALTDMLSRRISPVVPDPAVGSLWRHPSPSWRSKQLNNSRHRLRRRLRRRCHHRTLPSPVSFALPETRRPDSTVMAGRSFLASFTVCCATAMKLSCACAPPRRSWCPRRPRPHPPGPPPPPSHLLIVTSPSAELVTTYCRCQPVMCKILTEISLIIEFFLDDMRIHLWSMEVKQHRELVPRCVLTAAPAADAAVKSPMTRVGLSNELVNFSRLAVILQPMQELMTLQKQLGQPPRQCLQSALYHKKAARLATESIRHQGVSAASSSGCPTSATATSTAANGGSTANSATGGAAPASKAKPKKKRKAADSGAAATGGGGGRGGGGKKSTAKRRRRHRRSAAQRRAPRVLTTSWWCSNRRLWAASVAAAARGVAAAATGRLHRWARAAPPPPPMSMPMQMYHQGPMPPQQPVGPPCSTSGVMPPM